MSELMWRTPSGRASKDEACGLWPLAWTLGVWGRVACSALAGSGNASSARTQAPRTSMRSGGRMAKPTSLSEPAQRAHAQPPSTLRVGRLDPSVAPSCRPRGSDLPPVLFPAPRDWTPTHLPSIDPVVRAEGWHAHVDGEAAVAAGFGADVAAVGVGH